MPHRFALERMLTGLALVSMLGFLSLGCGDDNQSQPMDAGKKDVAVQDDAAPQEDAAKQQDAAKQADAANTGGQVLVLKIGPQLTGNPAIDDKIGSVRVGRSIASWDPIDPVDHPTVMVDQRVGPFGCYAKYYKFGQINDAGVASVHASSTANAGDISVTGYDAGQFVVGVSDAGVPNQFAPIPGTITCTRSETMNGDAGTGLFGYHCNIDPYGSAPVTAFMSPGVDKLHFTATGGGVEVGPFDVANVDVMQPIEVTVPGALWNAPALVQDAGVTVPYKCGTIADGGPAPCSGAMALQITWTDQDTTPPGLDPTPAVNEMGIIQCAKVGAGNSYTIPLEIWQTAFPAGNNWRTIQMYITHVSVKTAHGMSTVLGAGGGQIGMTYHP